MSTKKKAKKTAKKTAKKAEKPAEEVGLEIPALEIRDLHIGIVSNSSLIVHRFDEKSKQQMLDKQMKKATGGKKAKDPQACFESSLYHHPDGGYGFPSIGFKAAAVRAGKLCGMKMTDARQMFHIDGEYVRILGEPTMRDDVVRLSGGVSDIRFRGEFEDWAALITVKYRADIITPEQIANLFSHAGFSVGIGEWRPEKNGRYGMFRMADASEMKAIVREDKKWEASARRKRVKAA